MFKPLESRKVVATASLAALSGVLAWLHRAPDSGLASADITPALVASLAMTDGAPTTGAFLLDFVEPADGEGGSEHEIAELVAELNGQSGDATVVFAGPYSEGEHLYRLEGRAQSVQAVLGKLADNLLVEGIEAELVYTLPSPEAVVADVAGVAGVADGDVEPAKERARFVPNDPMFRLQWHMEQIHAPEAWTITRGRGAVVAVIDTGVAWKDGEGARAVPDLAGTTFVGGKTFARGGLPDGMDDHAHGTHVAGTIAQTTHNGIGVAGVAHEASIMPLKVLSASGGGSVGEIANAVRYAADNGAHVINMSLGGPLPSRVLAKAIEYAHQKGVTVVCAAGNEHKSRVSYPAANAGAVAVAAVDQARQLTFYSNWGKNIDVAAPGGDTRADKNGDGFPDGVLQNTIKIQEPLANDYLWFQGTSMASPHAAGVAALVVASGVTNPVEVERIMKSTALHPEGKTWDERYGAGIVDAAAAVTATKASYATERGGLAGLLGFAGLSSVGAGVATGSGAVLTTAGFVAGASLATGLVGAPLAYGIAGLFGAGGFGSPVVFSALLPVLLTVLLLGFRNARGLLTGLSLGYAALLFHGAIVLPTLMTGLPGGPAWDRLWLAANAIVCLLLARRIGHKT